LVFLAG